MDDPQKPSEKQPPPVPVPLDYGRPSYEQHKPTSSVLQAFLGFLLWIAALLIFIALIQNRWVSSNAQTFATADILMVIALSIWIRIQFRWRGFIPGVLLGFGLTCLVPVGIIAVVCGNWKL